MRLLGTALVVSRGGCGNDEEASTTSCSYGLLPIWNYYQSGSKQLHSKGYRHFNLHKLQLRLNQLPVRGECRSQIAHDLVV